MSNRTAPSDSTSPASSAVYPRTVWRNCGTITRLLTFRGGLGKATKRQSSGVVESANLLLATYPWYATGNPRLAIALYDEPEEKLRRVIELQLASAGFEVEKVGTAEQAIRVVDRADLVLTDLRLPGMDGMEVLRQIREDHRTANVPVVMYSAISDPEYVQFAKSRGATDFWIKSQIDFAKLHDLVSPYLIEPITENSN